ncbi:hypothetical protein TNCV_1593731 [Trichonephila clavipes]|nr:hypothetical protein TNCV_1593731 [Trichonephila clavipes]
MSSGYYMELDETAKARYDEKLSCNGNKLPDPFDQSTMEHVFVYNKKLWPPITFGDIYMYLVEKEYTYTREKMRNHKSLDAFNYVLSGKEKFVLMLQHFLFAVEMANNESPAPTSVACMWNKTSKKVDPEHNPDAPYLEDLTDEEETSSASETEHQEENHLPNLIELLRTKFSGMLKHVRADDSIHSMLLDCSLSHETIQNIELSTRDQASSAMWNHHKEREE